jgi:phospholipid/cholesterol/gamma-HCH transport system permease protein
VEEVEASPRRDTPPALHLRENGGTSLVLTGRWTLRGLARRSEELAAALQPYVRDSSVHWDLTQLEALDSVGAFVLWQACNGEPPRDLSVRPEHIPLFRRWSDRDVPTLEEALPERHFPFGQWLWELIALSINHVTDFLVILGQFFLDLGLLVRHPGRTPLRDISATIYQAGVRALGITALVGFLIGVVVGYLSALQLKSFGASIYIINIMGLSIIRELGPMLAAILVAGRSGSAMAAQLGVMRLTEELDALAAMGISRSLRLILPKVVALVIALPLLVLWTDAIGLVGGMLSAHATLGLSPTRFVLGLPAAVPIANLWLGLGKGAVFGAVIGLVASHFGMRIRPNTESLGVETTNAVVTAITLVILVDAVFAILFKSVGL